MSDYNEPSVRSAFHTEYREKPQNEHAAADPISNPYVR